MSWSQSAKRRLVWSIIHSPFQPPPGRISVSRTAGRCFSISSKRCEIAGSGFSFGEEGDQVIVELAKKRRKDVDTSSKRLKDSTKEDDTGAKEKEISLTNPPSEPHGRSATAEPLKEPDLRAQELDAATQYVRGLQTHPAGARDGRKAKAASLTTAKPSARKRVPTGGSPDLAEGKTANSKPRAKRTSTTKKRGPLAEVVRKQSAAADLPKDPVKEEAAARLEAARANPNLPHWAIQKLALTAKFGSEGWNPRRKLSPDAMLGIRTLHQDDPATFTTPVLAQQFKVSAEAIRRILKSKWLPKSGPEKVQEKRERWAKRHDRIWDTKSELGLRPKREEGQAHRVRDASEGAEELEHSLWADETLERARKEDPLVQKRFHKKARA